MTERFFDISKQLLELITNSYEANAAEVKCSFNYSKLNQRFSMQVEDDGIGMPSSSLERIKRECFSTKGDNRGRALHRLFDQSQSGYTELEVISPTNNTNGGCRIRIEWDRANIVGNLAVRENIAKGVFVGDIGLSFVLAMATYEKTKLHLDFSCENVALFMMDSEESRSSLNGVSISSASVIAYLTKEIAEQQDNIFGGISHMNSLDELNAMKSAAKEAIAVRDANGVKIVVAMGTCGINAGARETAKAFVDAINDNKFYSAAVCLEGCQGDCANEPIVDVVAVDGTKTRYTKVDCDMAKKIVADLIAKG